MKNNLFLLFIFAVLFSACQSESTAEAQAADSASAETYEIPELLDRHADLRQGTEWDQIQRLYVAQQQELRKDAQNAEAYLTLTQICINEARITGEHGHYYPAALDLVEQGLAVPGFNDDMRFRLLSTKASVQLSQHSFNEALATAQEAVKINPYNAQIYGALVDAYVELGDYDKAVKMADQMVNIRPDLRSYSRVSYLREIHGDVAGAIEAMELAISAGFPGQEATSWARLTLGELYETYGQPDKAKLQYQMALAEREDYPFAIAKLANLKMEEGDLAAAETELHRAAAIIPEFSFYVDLARLHQKRGETEKADEILAEVQLMLEDDVQSGHQMDMEYAFLYLDVYKNPKEALVYASKEYERRPNNIDVNRLLAKIYQELGESEPMQHHLKLAARTQSKHPDLLALAEK